MISPIEFSGMVKSSLYASNVKHNEDVKPLVDQQALRLINDRENEEESKQIEEKDDVDHLWKKFDAREKGSNQYEHSEQEKKKKKKDRGLEQEHLIKKAGRNRFDVTI